ncbi:YlxR family protein [Mycolicibacterium brumae]|uniref:DUF448 domain-containing protein n=1 Tax=Mycolicibacterium brumae TaxID=85968 RepID=A0A2G5P5M2_9MYCO|nr:YlxR family protein [Mycolicibacterium brumae]MCV7191561.1 YlxR family protein [Mycolicibacterium brumae]PIB73658.1 DUF448 domain-containing protein [Mycolicibacterium brumae]UWW09330.1 YlxR family protein [Mycolicibacterium brumae]
MIQRESSAAGARKHRSPHGPVRTCVGCRKRELAVDLVRVAAASNGNGEFALLVDTTGKLPGRGAWLHPTPGCLQAAIRRRAFARALRIAGSPEHTAVVEYFDSPGLREEQVSKDMSTP